MRHSITRAHGIAAHRAGTGTGRSPAGIDWARVVRAVAGELEVVEYSA
ncbi:hypothetical protein [Lentzea sp. NPDC060358]